MFEPIFTSEKLLYSTVLIEVNDGSGSVGTGTGFFFQWKNEKENTHFPVIITNKHVVKGSQNGRLQLHEGEFIDGDFKPLKTSFALDLDQFEKRWIPHPSPEIDLCALPFHPLRVGIEKAGRKIFNISLSDDIIWSDEKLENLSAVEDVLMAGYPIGLWDTVNNFPLLRKGITASHPSVDFCGESKGVVDIACFPGSSGSPILMVNEGGIYSDKVKKGAVIGDHRIAFLGVLYSGPFMTAEGAIEVREIPLNKYQVARTDLMINLGYYVKAKEIVTFGEYLKKLLERDKGSSVPVGATGDRPR